MQLDPIDQLLCDCLDHRTDEALIPTLKALSSSDWLALIEKAHIHFVSPVLYRRFKKEVFIECVPAEILGELRSVYFSTAKRNTIYFYNLKKVLSTIRDENLPVVVLKGAYLAEIIYKNLALRGMVDVDLLFKRTDLQKIKDILYRLGYSSSPSVIDAECSLDIELPPFFKLGSPIIDVHWTIENPNSPLIVELKELWSRTVEATIAGVNVRVLSPEDFLLHLCMHVSFHHRFGSHSLQSLCDITETLKVMEYRLDWDKLLLIVNQVKAQKCVYVTLRLLSLLFNTNVPKQFMDAIIQSDFDSEKESMILEQIFSNYDHNPVLTSRMIDLWRSPDLLSKLYTLLKLVFPSKKIMLTLYPTITPNSFIYICYYPLRVYDLIKKHGKTMWKLIHKNNELTVPKNLEVKGKELADWLIS